jgi:multidrug efflux pump subunit AcrA (membrane-fusion protein)
VSPTVDPSSRSVTVYVQVPNASNALKGGTFASGRVIARVLNDVLVVPTAAIRQRQDSGETFAYRISNGMVDYAIMKLGIVDDAQGVVQVLDGLQYGDRVVIGNVGLLGKGMKAQVLGTENRRRAAGKQ